MVDEINFEKIDSLRQVSPSVKDNEERPGGEHEYRRQQQESDAKEPPRYVAGHYDELEKEVVYANYLLEQEGSPYRFNLNRSDDNIFIDIVVLDEEGNIQQTLRKNITHHDFYRFRVAILEGEGLILDNIG